MGAAGGFAAGVTGTLLYGGSLKQALGNGLKGAATGAIMGGIFGGFAGTNFGDYGVSEMISKGLGGGVSSEIMGGKFEDGFKVAFVTAAAAYAYSTVSSKYNTNNGKPHCRQKGLSEVGKHPTTEELSMMDVKSFEYQLTDQSPFMKWVGKNIPYGDAFAEFHDGLHDFAIPGDSFSLIATMPPSYALTLAAATDPYTYMLNIEKNVNKVYN